MNFMPGQDVIEGSGAEENAEPAPDFGGDGDTAFVAGEKKPQANPVLLGVLGLAVVGAGLYYGVLRHGPATASAAQAPPPDAVATFLSNGQHHVQLMRQMLQDTDRVVAQFRASSMARQVPLKGLRTNPFQIAADQPDARTDSSSRRRHEEERLAAQAGAERLRLQSVLHGSHVQACMINNQLVQEGQEINGFTVEHIGPQSVIVRSGTFRFEVSMEK